MIIATFSLLAVLLFSIGYIMLDRLKRYFKDFYKHFGTKLWIANILLTLPLLFRGIIDLIKLDKAFSDWLFENYWRTGLYNIILITLATYVPMLLQISSLIFGFVRNKQVKLFRSFRESKAGTEESMDRGSRSSKRLKRPRPTYTESITSRSSISDTRSATSDNSFFDPPIENYRFYY